MCTDYLLVDMYLLRFGVDFLYSLCMILGRYDASSGYSSEEGIELLLSQVFVGCPRAISTVSAISSQTHLILQA